MHSVGRLRLPMAGLALALAVAVGCDMTSGAADKTAQSDIAKGIAARNAGGPGAEEKAMQLFQQAARAADLSPDVQAYARATVGATEADRARQLVREVRQNQIVLERLCYETGELLSKIEALHNIQASYAKFDPKPTQDGIARMISDAQGSPDHPQWVDAGVPGGGVPSLAKLSKDIERLQSAVNTNKEHQRSLTDQRNAKLSEAEAAQQSADAATGRKSVEEFDRAASLRKQAAQLSIQLDQAQAAAWPLEQDLGVAQAQQAQVTEAVRLMHEQSQALDGDFHALQEQSGVQAALSKTILGEGTDPGGALAAAVAAKAVAIAQVAQEIKSDSESAQTSYNDAANSYQQAETAGQAVQREMSRLLSEPANATSKLRPVWTATMDAFHPNVFRLRRAIVNREAGDLLTGSIRSLSQRLALQQQAASVLGAAGMDVPKELADASVQADLQTAKTTAEDRFKSADDALSNIVNGVGARSVQQTAKVDRVLALYDWALKARQVGDEATAKTHLADAIAQKNDANGVVFPPLPPELMVENTPPTTAPGGT